MSTADTSSPDEKRRKLNNDNDNDNNDNDNDNNDNDNDNKDNNDDSISMTVEKLASMIDHTFLKSYGDGTEISKLCQEARDHGFASVAIHGCMIEECAALLSKEEESSTKNATTRSTKICVVVGFPLGQSTVQAMEAADAIERGAQEIDMVLNVYQLQQKQYDKVQQTIESVTKVCHDKNIIVKVILETCYLTKDEIIKACEICKTANVDFVKTSTGFGTGGATVEDVKLMRSIVGPNMGVKASGGVRTWSTAKAMIQAGATRIGTSNGVQIISEFQNEQQQQEQQQSNEKATTTTTATTTTNNDEPVEEKNEKAADSY